MLNFCKIFLFLLPLKLLNLIVTYLVVMYMLLSFITLILKNKLANRTYQFNISIAFNLFIVLIIILCKRIIMFSNLNFDFNIINNNNLNFLDNKLGFYFDNLSIIFSTTILIIGYFSNTVAIYYLKDDINKNRFFFFLNMFLISMVILTLSTDILILFLTWELLGITSFFLISHYFYRSYSIKAALKALVFNRLSDIFMIIFFLLYFKLFNSTNITVRDTINNYSSNILSLSLVLASMCKSAQFIFFFWLPDSMEAPIPASALIHSATLVAAGVYMLIRFNHIIEYSYISKIILLIFSCISMILFSFIALIQNDIKRLLAYSTISNCAFMYFLIAQSNYTLSLIFFYTHGLVKSCLFLMSGTTIIIFKHNQDIKDWNLKNFYSINIIMCIYLLLISLSGFFFTQTYEVKHMYNFSHSYLLNSYWYIIIFYSIVSYMYGLKIFFLINLKKYIKNEYNNLNILNLKHIFYINQKYLIIIILSIILLSVYYYNCIFIYDHNTLFFIKSIYLVFITTFIVIFFKVDFYLIFFILFEIN